MSAIMPAAVRKLRASTSTTAEMPYSPITEPPTAGPSRRARLLLRALSELALSRRSSATSLGSSAFSAGRKNWVIDDCTKPTPYATQTRSADCTRSSGSSVTASSRLEITIVRLRSHRSTKTPATDPNNSAGISSAMNMPLVARVEPVSW